MSRAPVSHRLLKVLGDLCNGTIDPRDGEWLEELLSYDAEVQAVYVDYMAMHACLHAECATLGQPADAASSLNENVGRLSLAARFKAVAGRENSTKVLSFLKELREHRWMLAAALVGIAVFSSILTYMALLHSGRFATHPVVAGVEGENGGASRQHVVARITGTQNCLWKHSPAPVGYGTELIAGQKLELREGLAEITFGDGATVLLESPATFTVNAPHEVALQQGRLAAVVPKQSRGFRVHTRSLDVFEVGTEFGLLVKQSGASEVHVFSGLVRADVLDSSGHPFKRLELNASEAARVSLVSTSVVEFPANEAAFVRSMVPSSGPQDGLLGYEGFNYPEGPLSAQNGGFGWAGPWFSIAADSNAGPDSNRVSSGSLATEGILPLGNRAVQTAQQNRIRRSLSTSVGGVFDVAGLVENQDGVRLIGRDGNQVYVSFLQRVSAINDGFYGLELHRSDGNANRVLCIGNGAEGTGYGVTSNYNVHGLKDFPALGNENTETNFFVVKISFGVDNHDVVEVFCNPASLRDEQACQADVVLKGNFAFDRISVANFDGTKIHEADEIRVGTHFLAVTGRWGGERGRLLRRITQQSRPDREPGQLAMSLAVATRLHNHVRWPWAVR